MGPLRMKGRGGGSGKTEALMPGQVPGISPVQALDKKSSATSVRRESSPFNGGLDKKSTASSLRKEVEKRSSTAESLATIVSRSFQKERGERRAPDLSNVLPAVAQRVGRLKKEGKSEPNSAENSPRMKDLMSYHGLKNEEREKRFYEAIQQTTASRKSSSKGNDVQPTRCMSNKDAANDRPRSASWDFDEKLAPRVALKEMDRMQEQSRRSSTPRAASVNAKSDSKVRSGTALDNETRNISKSSPMNHTTSHLSNKNKSSPQLLHVFRDEALMASLPGKTPCSCGPSKNAAVNSPLQAGLNWINGGDKVVQKTSTIRRANSSPLIQNTVTETYISEGKEGNEPEALNTIQSSLFGRLSLLEGRVSQMATELRETKELLDANNPICSKALLIDIQSKITNIERAMTGSRSGSGSLSVESISLRERISSEQQNFKKALQSITDENQEFLGTDHVQHRGVLKRIISESPTLESKLKSHFEKHPPVSRLGNSTTSYISKMQDFETLDYNGFGTVSSDLAEAVFDGNGIRDSPYLQNKLMKNRPSLHQKLVEQRVALHEKLKQNRELMRRKLADLGGRERLNVGASNDGALVAAEFLTSLDDTQGLVMEGDDAMQHLKVLLEERNASVNSAGSSAGRIRVLSPVVLKQDYAHAIPKGHSYYPTKAATPSSYGKHRYSDVTSNSPSSEQSSPSYSRVLAPQQDSRTLRVEDSIDGDFAEILHLRETDANEAPKYSTKASNMKQSSIHRPAERIMVSETFSCDLNCDEDLLLEDDINRDYCAPLGNEEGETSSGTSEGRLRQIGEKTATAGWFVCEGEGLVLAHEDGFCSYHDVANMEEKSEYRGPHDLAPGVWGDCWLIRAAGTDGRSNKYIVAASAGGAMDSAFCSWDYYDRSITAYHCQPPSIPTSPVGFSTGSTSLEQGGASSPRNQHGQGSFKKWFERSSTFNLTRFSGNTGSKKTFQRSISMDTADLNRGASADVESRVREVPLWWYRPCGALLASAASGLRTVSLYDVRDGDVVMRWDTKKSVAAMSYCSPLQWRTKGKLVLAEEEGLSFWDVDSLEARRLHNVNLIGKQLRALHVHNVDAECSGGVRQRLSSSEHHSDGVLCTNEAINILDFRVPTGIAMKIPTFGEETHSVFANGDAVLAGVTRVKTRLQPDGGSKQTYTQCSVNQWSIRQGKPMNVYTLPDTCSHSSHLSITQVWGSSEAVMAANGNGLFVFDGESTHASGQESVVVRNVIGSNDLDNPKFDFVGSRVLLVSRDRPATWCHWP